MLPFKDPPDGDDVIRTTDVDDEPPPTPSSTPLPWIVAHRVYDLEDEVDSTLKIAISLDGFDKPSGQANLPTRRSFFFVINPSPPVHFIREVICKLRRASN